MIEDAGRQLGFFESLEDRRAIGAEELTRRRPSNSPEEPAKSS